MLLVHPGGPFWAQRDLGAWSIPKGGSEEGEDLRRCALRELREELGPGARDRGSRRWSSSARCARRAARSSTPGPPRAISTPATLDSNTFAIEWPPRSGNEREFPEVDRAEWFDPGAAREKLIEAQTAFVDRLLEHLGYSAASPT